VRSRQTLPQVLPNESSTLRQLAALLAAGLPLRRAQVVLQQKLEAVEPTTQVQLENLLLLAAKYGGSIVWSLEALANQIEGHQKLVSQIEVAVAPPRATAKLVLWLPLVCLALAQLIGINVFAAAAHNAAVPVSLLIGGVLLWVNHKVLAKITRGAIAKVGQELSRVDSVSRLVIEAAAGVPLARVSQQNLDAETAELLALATVHGLELLPLLKRHSRQKQRQLGFELELQFSKLAIQMLTPIGLLALPALVFLAVIPASMSLITN